MNFQASFSNSPTVIKLINAPSWSSCLAYCEETGLVQITIHYKHGLMLKQENLVLALDYRKNLT